MDLKQAIETRGTVRDFKPEPVPVQDLRQIVQLAGRAPSVNNAQPWRYIAIESQEIKAQMAEIVRHKLHAILPPPNDEVSRKVFSQVEHYSTSFETAPTIVAVASRRYEAILDQALAASDLSHHDVEELRGNPTTQSIGASVQTFLLAAHAMGYATCWLAGPLVARLELQELLAIQRPWRLATMIAVGRPAKPSVSQAEKKPLEEIFEFRG